MDQSIESRLWKVCEEQQSIAIVCSVSLCFIAWAEVGVVLHSMGGDRYFIMWAEVGVVLHNMGGGRCCTSVLHNMGGGKCCTS